MVVGASDGEDVEKIVALISSEDELDIDGSAIKEFVQGQLADSKVPDIVLKVVEIRRSPTGNGDYRWGKVTAIKQSQKQYDSATSVGRGFRSWDRESLDLIYVSSSGDLMSAAGFFFAG